MEKTVTLTKKVKRLGRATKTQKLEINQRQKVLRIDE